MRPAFLKNLAGLLQALYHKDKRPDLTGRGFFVAWAYYLVTYPIYRDLRHLLRNFLFLKSYYSTGDALSLAGWLIFLC